MSIVVVRNDIAFDAYVKAWGSAHIIMQLPTQIVRDGTKFTPDMGIGYARLSIQLIASHWEIDWVHMWYETCYLTLFTLEDLLGYNLYIIIICRDDNVRQCQRFEVTDGKLLEVSFDSVFEAFEEVAVRILFIIERMCITCAGSANRWVSLLLWGF